MKGEAVQRILEQAEANVAIIRDHGIKTIKNILVPLSFGVEEHAFRIQVSDYIARANKAKLTLLTVVHPDTDAEKKKRIKGILEEAKKLCKAKTETKIVEDINHVEYLIRASKKYSMMVLGPSRQWVSHAVVLGADQDKIANHASCTILMIKQYEPRAESWFNLLFSRMEDWFFDHGWMRPE